jgi:nucleotide-binding universal stress UspA family protein
MKVLLAYDGLARSRAALDEVARTVAEQGGSVTVLTVTQPEEDPYLPDDIWKTPGAHDLSIASTSIDRNPETRHHAPAATAEDVADGARDYLVAKGLDADAKVEGGEAAEAILAEARAGGYDLLVVGSRKHGRIARFLLGSVSHEIADNAPCSVLIVGEGRSIRIDPR